MIDLFGSAGREAVATLGMQRTLYAFDYDGTLSPIVADPQDARAASTTVALLAQLGARVPTLLLTGRGADDLRRRIAFTPTHLVGNHGAEGMPAALTDEHALAASRDVVLDWLSQWPVAGGALASDPAILVEAKTYSLSIHYRKTADHDAAKKAIDRAVAMLTPSPRVIGGKCVFNLLPAGAPDKGRALAALVGFEHCTSAFFIGDDVTDECAFDVAPPGWVTVRVGRSDASKARYFIEEQGDIDRCLALLVASAPE